MTKNSARGDGEQVEENSMSVEMKEWKNAKMIDDYRQGGQRRSNICLNASARTASPPHVNEFCAKSMWT